ncbi:MAG: formate dehydrogenase subunit delta [Dehalococcoidia bacterium]
MDDAKMVHRANDIAKFWEPYTHDEAVAGIAGHISSFWEPRFRRQLVEYAETGGAGLHETVKEAIQLLQARAKSS